MQDDALQRVQRSNKTERTNYDSSLKFDWLEMLGFQKNTNEKCFVITGTYIHVESFVNSRLYFLEIVSTVCIFASFDNSW